MVSQLDRYRSAQQVIDRHGPEAQDHACRMMRRFLDKGDVQGAGVWLAIGDAIEDLQNLTAGTIH